MIVVALPPIIEDFNTDLEAAGWLVTGYLIALAALQPVTGKIGDRFGRRRMMFIGLTMYAAVSLGAALAPSLVTLILFRVLQGVAGAIILPNGLALMREIISVDRRASGFGLLGAAIGIAAGLGPTLGGLLVAAADWRAVFYVNVPIIALGLFMVWRFAPKQDTTTPGTVVRVGTRLVTVPRSASAAEQRPFDFLGSVLLSVVLVGTALLVLQGRDTLSVAAIAVIALALLVAVAVLVRHEFAHPDPVIHPRLFRNRPFTAATGGVCLSNLSFYTTLIAVPIVLATNFDWSSVQIGLALTLLSGPAIVCAPLGGRLADRIGRRAPAVGGLAIATIGLLPLAILGDENTGVLLASLLVAGAGFGLALASHQTVAVESVPAEDAGVASGLFSTGRYIGSIVGSMALAVLLVTTTAGTTGFQSVAVMTTVAALLATLVSMGLPGRKDAAAWKARAA